jgi:hypothetical protein
MAETGLCRKSVEEVFDETFRNNELKRLPRARRARSQENEIGFAVLYRGRVWTQLHSGRVGENPAVEHGLQLLQCDRDWYSATLIIVPSEEAGTPVSPVPIP